jgi:glycosyltransferase involved in cell wall biosynthesis
MAGVLVHEWIAQSGGSENVLQAFSEMYPEADIVCLWNESEGRFDPARLRESWLAGSPLRHRKALALPFMPAVWRFRPNRGYDWALISSHLFAHHVHFRDQPADFDRFVYVHSPARYIWAQEQDARGGGPLVRVAAQAFKPLDRRRAQQSGSRYAANSAFIRGRVRECWQVDAEVIYPPVDVLQIQAVTDWRERLTAADAATFEQLPPGYFLGASRFVGYKRLDLVIRTGELAGRPVVLAGRGPEMERLRQLAAGARVPVHVVEHPSRALLYALYQQAGLYVFPAVEDFGIMPVEALAAGAPVLAQRIGGTAETIVPGLSGALSEFRSEQEMKAAADEAMATSREARLKFARQFSLERFRHEIACWTGRP